MTSMILKSHDSITKCINKGCTYQKFPDELKLSDITAVYKKLDPSDKVSCIPVSISRSVSKVFEKDMYEQLDECIENFLNKFI